MTKKIKIALSTITSSLVLLPFSVLAYTSPTNTPTATVSNVGTVVDVIVGKIWIVFAAIAVIMFVWAGVTFLTANGQPEKIQQARQAAIWGVLGVVVMILAFSIFQIATNLIGGT